MKKIFVLICQIGIIACLALLVLSPGNALFAQQQGTQSQQYFKGRITEVKGTKEGNIAMINIESGSLKGKTVEVGLIPDEKSRIITYEAGDRVVVLQTETPGQPPVLYIVDYVRTTPILVLLAIFVGLVLAIGRWHGILSIISMMYSFLIINNFILPNIILGNDPIFISLMGGLLISPVTFYLSHGFNKKTTVAVIGTVASLLFTGLLSIIFVNYAKLTGITSDEALFVQSIVNTKIDLRSLLLAGMIIGLLGILDDVTVSQAAIVEKLRTTGKDLDFRSTFLHAMDVGKDHIASLVNTLVLVYAGASLPLFLLFSRSGLSVEEAISTEVVATEIIRTLVGSVGLVAAVPLTTLLACIVFYKQK